MKKIFIDEIGSIELIPSSRSSNISISVKFDGRVRVSYPRRLSAAKIMEAILSRKQWIKKHQQRVQKNCCQNIFTSDTEFYAGSRKLIIKKTKACKPYSRISENELTVFCPLFTDEKDPDFQNFIRDSLVRALKKSAEEYIVLRAYRLARESGFKPDKIRITSAKTRWGSCSGKNSINLSLFLMQLPKKLIDFVIMHELVHTIEKNHGERFYEHLSRFFPDFRNLDKELNSYIPGVFGPSV